MGIKKKRTDVNNKVQSSIKSTTGKWHNIGNNASDLHEINSVKLFQSRIANDWIIFPHCIYFSIIQNDIQISDDMIYKVTKILKKFVFLLYDKF